MHPKRPSEVFKLGYESPGSQNQFFQFSRSKPKCGADPGRIFEISRQFPAGSELQQAAKPGFLKNFNRVNTLHSDTFLKSTFNARTFYDIINKIGFSRHNVPHVLKSCFAFRKSQIDSNA